MDFENQITGKSDEELLKIYINSGEYQDQFVELVFRELNKRNVPVEAYQNKKILKSAIVKQDFEKGIPGNEFYIVLCFAFAVVGGFIGIIGGYVYSQSKHSDNTGERYYAYDKKTRNLGRAMMIIGIFSLLVTMIWKFS